MKLRFKELLLPLSIFCVMFPAGAQQSEIDRVHKLLENGSQEEAKQAIFDCANSGNKECQFELAKYVEEGRLFQRDLETSKKLFELSYAGGYEPAGKELLRLTRKLASEGEDSYSNEEIVQPSVESADMSDIGDSLSVSDVGGRDDLDCQSARRIGIGSHVDCGIEIEVMPMHMEEGRLVVRVTLNNNTSESRIYGLSDIRAIQNSKQIKILSSTEVAALKPKNGQGARRGLRAASLLVGVLGEVVFDEWGAGDLLASSAVEGASSGLDEIADNTNGSGSSNDYVDAVILNPWQKSSIMLMMQLQGGVEDINVEFDVGRRTAILPMRIDGLPER